MRLKDTPAFKASSPYCELSLEQKLEHLNNIPDEMRHAKQWCLWRIVAKKIKSKETKEEEIICSKVPFQPTGAGAMANEKKTWSSFDIVQKTFKKHYDDKRNEFGLHTTGFDGVGFMSGNGLGFADFDHCVKKSPDDKAYTCRPFWQGVILEFANKLEHCFVEYSQSGHGLHIFFKGSIPHWLVKPEGGHMQRSVNGTIELYLKTHFCAVTGVRFEHSLLNVSDEVGIDVTEQLSHAASIYCWKSSSASSKDKSIEVPIEPTDQDIEVADELLDQLSNRKFSKNKINWADVFFNGTEPSDNKSSCDLQLALFLKSFFRLSRKKAGLLLAMMNKSVFGQREKWTSRSDYRINTIQTALSKSNRKNKKG